MSQFQEPNLPATCCTEIPANGQCDFNGVTVSTDGCMAKLKNTIEDKAVILGAVGIGIALVQVNSFISKTLKQPASFYQNPGKSNPVFHFPFQSG